MKVTNLLKLLFVAVIMTTAYTNAKAVPAYPYPIKITQPDGSTITISLHGDEHFWYATTSDGYNVVRAKDGFYYYAQIINGSELAASAMRANEPSRRTNKEKEFIKTVNKGFPAGVAAMARQMKAPAADFETTRANYDQFREATQNGQPFNSLVILVEFSDISFQYDNSHFENLLMQDGYNFNGATGSAWNYYTDNSNGRFNPNFEVVGPYKLPNTASHYAGSTGNERSFDMFNAAINAALNDGVSIARYADGNVVRDIFIFYAGDNQAEGGTGVWPHRYTLTNGAPIFTSGGYNVYAFACTSELGKLNGQWSLAGIGTFCHEFGHVLGWPDFYDTDGSNNGNSYGLGYFSLMSSGSYNNTGRTPPAISAFERSMVEWGNPVAISSAGDYELDPIYNYSPSASGNFSYKIETGNEGEYFVLEYRHGNDSRPWDNFWANGDSSVGMTGRGGSGMMVQHVDRSNNTVGGRSAASLWATNQVNAFREHQALRIIMAKDITSDAKPTDFGYILFPGAGNVTGVTYSDGRLVPWSGDYMGIEITNIVEESGVLKFSLTEGTIASNLTADAGQFDVTLAFNQSVRTNIRAVCTPVGGGTAVSITGTNQHGKLNVSVLKPDTEYEAYIETISGLSRTETITFRTQAVDTSKVPTIEFDSSAQSGTRVGLRVINLTGDVKSIKWYVNKQNITTGIFALTTGLHTIKCIITNADGSTEILTRYITV